MIDSISFVKRGRVRRAKLYYLRDRIGKAARIKEKIVKKGKKKKLKSEKTSTVLKTGNADQTQAEIQQK